MQERVCYFSKGDLSTGYYLEMAEKRIQEVSEEGVPTDLEGIIELWHIKRMIDDECRFLEWSDEKFNTLKQSTSGYNTVIANFFNSLNPKMIKSEFKRLDWNYKRTFWKIIDAYKLYRLIEPETLREIISENTNNLRVVLEYKGLVDKYKSVIREELLRNKYSAHILLDKYVGKLDSNREAELFLPSNLTLEEKELILVNYMKSDEPNVNYVRLITQVKDIKGQIIISPRTKLLAQRLEKRLNEEMRNDPNTEKTRKSIGIQFLDEEEIGPLELIIDEKGVPSYVYSVPYIRKCDNKRRVLNCISLFGWMNHHFLIDLINKSAEVDPIESLLIDKGRDSYPSFMIFERKNRLALYQLYGYSKVLFKEGCSFENELKQFYENHFKEEYAYPSLFVNIPNPEDSTLNKCRVLCPELDAIVKQYNTFVEERVIDKDLIKLSKPIKVEEGKSLLVDKYYEIVEDNDEVKSVLLGLFGSGNSLLSYVEPFKNKNYHSLAELLEKENNVLYSHYADFQKPHLDFLIKQDVVSVNSEGRLYITSQSKLNVLKSLWEYGVCSYWHYNDEERKALDDMLEKGWLTKDGHLLTRAERDYFSYYLDNAKFTNGWAYRNHYMHGSTSAADDENEHSVAYMTFLRLLAILLIKIEDDLWLARKVLAINTKDGIAKKKLFQVRKAMEQ